VIAVAQLLLVFIGIDNAWDTITYVAIKRAQRRKDGNRAES